MNYKYFQHSHDAKVPPIYCLKHKELLILQLLRQNARFSLTEISERTNIPISTIHDIIARLKKRQLIQNFIAIPNYSSLGYMTHVNITISCSTEQIEKIIQFISTHPNINSLYQNSKHPQILVEMIFKVKEDLDAFVNDLKTHYKIYNIETFKLKNHVVKEQFLVNNQPISI